jgi:alkanesulfonate monooxygenase SsuD/methylene tetrahydromethanopterin reductase-like flavin-dependent oxidoreductase (luciferase family)
MLLPLRQPAVTAKELASVDVISGGRLVVGVGAGGEFPPEFDACGVPLANRGARLEESIALLRAYWSGETVNFRGRYFDASDVRLDLLPSQSGGPPIWVGGRSLHAQRRAGRIGDGYLPYLFTPSQCREARHVVEEAAIAAGRDVAEAFPFALQQYVSLGEPAAARAAAVADLTWRYNQRFDDLVDRYCICGPSEKILQELGHYVDAGVTHLLLTPIAPGGNESAAVEEIASVLLPELRRVC